jgi:urea carboxylase-associated protein 2
VPDTVKVLWQAYLGGGHLLLSDQGRVLASFVGDGSGHHDALAGTSNRAGNEQRYGDGSVHGPSPAGRELLVVLAAKHGLTGRDLPPSVTLLKGTRIEPDGTFAWQGGSGPGGWVELRAELPLIVLVANVPHVLDPRPGYASSALRLTAWTGRPTSPDDPLWTSSPEAERAFQNTDLDARARGSR